MIGDKKVMGVCLAALHDRTRSEYINIINRRVAEAGWKLVVFNSFGDFGKNGSGIESEKSIYELVNFDIVDVLLIYEHSIGDDALVDRIVKRAKEHSTPVIIMGGKREGCFSISSVYEDAYAEMLEHIISGHSAQSMLFIAGSRKDDEASDTRLECCAKVMKKHGLPFNDHNIEYSEGMDDIVRSIVVNRIEGNNLPDAIVCVNDDVAITVCETLYDNGINVPEDCIVTGFGGIPAAYFLHPSLTTCSDDMTGLAGLIIETANSAIAGAEPKILTNAYRMRIRRSCGCDRRNGAQPTESRYSTRNALSNMYRLLDEVENYDDRTNAWLEGIFSMEDTNSLFHGIENVLGANSYLCINEDMNTSRLDPANEDVGGYTDELMVIPSKNLKKSGESMMKMRSSEMIPDFANSVNDCNMFVLTPLVVDEIVCGYYVFKTEKLNTYECMLKRYTVAVGFAFRALINRARQSKMLENIENLIYRHSMTGLPNIKGVTKWFEDFAVKKENHSKSIAISVYSMPRYTYIYENYGMYEIEESVRFVADTIREIKKPNCYAAHISESEFVVISYFDSANEVSGQLAEMNSKFFATLENKNNYSNKEYIIEVNNGVTVLDAGWDGSLESFVKMAVSDMYLNSLQSGIHPVVKDKTFEREYFNTFDLLVERNLFKYHYQPIVNAHNGEIIGYEALMRTGGGISMSPLDVLDIARNCNRLYDIEKATMFNIISNYAYNPEAFAGRKIFVNTIPGYFLNNEDRNKLLEEYGEWLDYFVYEVTEQNTISNEELNLLKGLCNSEESAKIAVDDYGTGHSNIVNLLRYAPHVIKIDRYLISGIQDNTNKQMFVKNTIEFAALNGIKVLAEGVETLEEMKKVIEYGVDYIQGYYTARPAAEPLDVLPDKIRDEIIAENIRVSKFENNRMVYAAKAGETINLLELALKKYTYVNVHGGMVRFVGEKSNMIDIMIKTADDSHTSLVFENVNIKGDTEPSVQLGRNSNTTITLVGNNTLNKDGIQCTEGSNLRVTGDGSLQIFSSRKHGVGVGSKMDEAYGDMTFDLSGTVKIVSNGDRITCIGGGRCTNSKIRLVNGRFDLSAKGIATVSVGTLEGSSDIFIGDVSCRIKNEGNDSVCIGSLDGRADISSIGMVEVTGDGENSVGLGTAKGAAYVSIDGKEVRATLHTYSGTAVGSVADDANIIVNNAKLNIYCEGTMICGAGSHYGSGHTEVNNSSVDIEILAGASYELGQAQTQTFLNSGRIFVARENNASVTDRFGNLLEPFMENGGKLFAV